MPDTYQAVQITEPDGPLTTAQLHAQPPGRGQVAVAVEAAGICHSDALFRAGHMPGVTFPLVTGHEIAGRVAELGDGVEGFEPGDRVAIGWFGGNCGRCLACREGDFIHCEFLQIPGAAYPGGYAERVVVPAVALARIPDALSAVDAAPMGCAGVTTFNALQHSAARPGDVVAVQGIGGLGHLGVQFARAMGFETVAIARGGDKEKLALELGAHHYIDSEASDPAAELKKLGGAKVILATVTSNAAIASVLDGLRHRGELIVVGVDAEPLSLNTFSLILPGTRVVGHPSGTARETEETMRFASLAGIKPMSETAPLTGAQAAFDKMMSGDARFRMVLTT